MNPKLVAAGGHELEIPALPCRIGTASTNEIPIRAGLGVAGHHLTIQSENGQYYIEDLGTGLLTSVNGTAIIKSELKHGDRVQIGQLSLTFTLPAATEEKPERSPDVELNAEEADAPGADERSAEEQPEKIPAPAEGVPQFNPTFPKPATETTAVKERSPVGRVRKEVPHPGHVAGQRRKRVIMLGTALLGVGMLVAALMFSKKFLNTDVPEVYVARMPAGAAKGIPAKIPETRRTEMLIRRLADDVRPGVIVSLDARGLKHLVNNAPTALADSLKSRLGKIGGLTLDHLSRFILVGGGDDDFIMAIGLNKKFSRDWLAKGRAAGIRDVEGYQVVPASDVGPDLAMCLVDGHTLLIGVPESVEKAIQSPPSLAASRWVPGRFFSSDELSKARGAVHVNRELLASEILPEWWGDHPELSEVSATLSTEPECKLSSYWVLSDEKAESAFVSNLVNAEQRKQALSQVFSQQVAEAIQVLIGETKALDDHIAIGWEIGPRHQRQFAFQALASFSKLFRGRDMGASYAEMVSAERAAQHAAAVFHTAKTAGAGTLGEVTSVSEALQMLVIGVPSNEENQTGRIFRIPRYGETKRRLIMEHLVYEDGSLKMKPHSKLKTLSAAQGLAIAGAHALASEFDAALAAKADLALAVDAASAVKLLADEAGVTGTGAFAEEIFGYAMDETRRTAALEYLQFKDKRLTLKQDESMAAVIQDPRFEVLKPRQDALALVSKFKEATQTGAPPKDIASVEDALNLISKKGSLVDPNVDAVKAFLRLEENELVFYEAIEGE